MKSSIFHIAALLGTVAITLSFSNGPAGGSGSSGVRMQDRSGSPFAIAMGPTCAACHNSGSFNPDLNIELTQDGQVVELYIPSEVYKLRYTLTANAGSPSKFGVQSVVLTNDGDNNIGTFGAAPSGTRIADISSRKYFEHSSASNNDVFEIEWTAPSSGSGNITVYAAGITANGNGGNSGDNGIANTLVLSELTSSNNTINTLPVKVSIYPNPALSKINLTIQSELSGSITLELYDLNGKKVVNKNIDLSIGENVFSEDVSSLSSGIYFLKITDGLRERVVKVLKAK